MTTPTASDISAAIVSIMTAYQVADDVKKHGLEAFTQSLVCFLPIEKGMDEYRKEEPCPKQ